MAGDEIVAAQAALARGEFDAAISVLREATLGAANPAARHMLGGLLFCDDDFAGARHEFEQAFRELVDAGEVHAAAMVTADLADLFVSGFGNRIVGESWQRHGRQLLAPVGRCVEIGYVDLAVIACEVDVDELLSATSAAAGLADEFGDGELAVLAMADAGYARVVQGDVTGGFAMLDDAMTSLCSGAIRNTGVIGRSYCALMSACDRSGDVRRGLEWIDTLTQTVIAPLGGRPRASRGHCHLAYGSLMCTAGQVSEGEASILRVFGRDGSAYAAHRTEAAARLASLRLTQGRVEEAAELLRPVEDRLPVCEPLARVHLVSGDLELAAAVARRGVEAAGNDRLRAGSLLGILVEIALANEDLEGAVVAVESFERLAADASSAGLRAEALLARGRYEIAAGDAQAAVNALEAALASLPDEGRPLLRATVLLELGRALASTGDRGRATDHVRAALAGFERLGARFHIDAANGTLRSLGVRGRAVGGRAGATSATLTAREREVLDLVRSGLSNAEIASRLYISTKTAEHHVGRVLAKLGVRSRAEAAAVAAAAAASAPQPDE